jgi:RNA polymerase sigma-70 factor, ECF subfamily
VLSKDDITATLFSERLSITAFLATVTRNYHLAEDVYQDVCVKAIGRDELFESKSHLLNWIRLAGRNRAIDLLRARDGQYEGLSEKILESLSAIWNDRLQSQGHDRRSALERCFERLTENNRQLVRMRYFEGRSGAEVAEILGRKLETVYQALARIHKSLGECVLNELARLEHQP